MQDFRKVVHLRPSYLRLFSKGEAARDAEVSPEISLSLDTVQTVILRFGLAAHALVAWKIAADLWESGNLVYEPFAVILALIVFAVSFVMLGLAVRDKPGHRAHWLIALMIPLAFVAYWHIDTVRETLDHYSSTSDAWVYAEYSAHLVQAGQNPYQANMLNAFAAERISWRMQTPLLDGGTASHYAYPALGFLIHVPFVLLGINPLLVYPLLFLLTVIALYRWTPPIARPLVLLPIFLDPHYMAYAFGGVNDVLWVFPLLLMIAAWGKHWQRGLWFGLACAAKQHPWFLGPFLCIRLWKETEGQPREQRVRQIAEFLAVSVGVFLLINAPYILWDAKVWLSGMFSPMSDSMILLGQGLSSLTLFDLMTLPKTFFSVLSILTLIVGLILYWRHFRQWREILWLLPALSLWLNYRSLNSYWYFFLIPFLLALLRQLVTVLEQPSSEPSPPLSKAQARLSAALLAVIPLLLVGGVGWASLHQPDIRLTLQDPMYTRQDRVFQMQVLVYNHTDNELTPRFSVQSPSSQPLFWTIENGPLTVSPNGSATYTLTSDISGFNFSSSRGAQLILNDAHNPDLRTSLRLPVDESSRFYDAIPNGEFRFWDIDTNAPVRWGLLTSQSGTARMVSSSNGTSSALELTVQDATQPDWSTVMLETFVPVPFSPVEIWVKPPSDANLAPSFNLIYGVEVRATWSDKRVWILFGDEAGYGMLAPDLPYWMIAAPRDTWSLQTIDVRQIFESLHIDMGLPRRIVRYDLPFATSMMNFRLLLAARQQENADFTAQFGAVQSSELLSDPNDIISEDAEHPEWNLLWQGELDYTARNFEAARDDYAGAILANPHLPDGYMGLGRANFALQNWDSAVNAFELAIMSGYYPAIEAQNLIAQALEAQGLYEDAFAAYQEAEIFIAANPIVGVADQVRTYLGLGEYYARAGHCEIAVDYFTRALALESANAGAQRGLSACRAATGN